MQSPGAKKAEPSQTGFHPSARPPQQPLADSLERPHEHPRTYSYAHAHEHRRPHYISLRLRDISQLFNSMDPSPFIEKDLDDDAEEFIVSWAQEYSADTPLRLRIHLDQWPSETGEDPREMIKTAVHNHFAHRAQITGLELNRLLKQGRTSLLIGTLFLSVCLGSSQILLGHNMGTLAEIVRESLTIAGWVAMWRPMQIYLYDWWPVRRRRRVYAKLAQMPVEVVSKPQHEAKPKVEGHAAG